MENNEYNALAKSERDHWWFISLRRKIKRVIRPRIHVDRKTLIFDAGCGTGFLVKWLSDSFPYCIQAECCEPSSVGRIAASRYNIFPINAHIADLPDSLHGNYDIVTCIDVLYHRDVDPVIAVRKLCDLLRPGGTLIINTASLPCLRRVHDSRVHGARRFTLVQIEKLITNENMTPVEAYYWNVHLAPLVYFIALIERFSGRSFEGASDVKTPPRWLNSVLILLSRLESLLPIGSHNILRPFGSSIFLVAQKPL